MKIFNKACRFDVSFKMAKVFLFCLFTLSASAAFSQSNDYKNYFQDPEAPDQEVNYGLSLAPAREWILAKNSFGIWSIGVIDAVSGNILTGSLTVGNLDVSWKGVLFGTFTVLNKWGYGSNLGPEAEVGVSAINTISFPGFPSYNLAFSGSHTYVASL